MNSTRTSNQHNRIRENVKVSIIVVSYNTRNLTAKCIESIVAQTKKHAFEIIVFDNDSKDGSASHIRSQFPQVTIMESRENIGFAAANNRAAEYAQGKYLLLLNPDTVILDAAIDNAIDFADSLGSDTIVGARTLRPDGALDPSSCWRRPTIWGLFCRSTGLSALLKNSKVFNFDSYGSWKRDTVRQVDIVTGCFLLLSRQRWSELGGFDESYFMYGEDWDLSIRARRANIKGWHCPAATIIHYGGASETLRAEKLIRLLRAQVALFQNHFRGIKRVLPVGLLHLWVLRCMIVGYLLRRAPNAWAEVWERRGEWKSTKEQK